MKRFISSVLGVCLIVAALGGCSQSKSASAKDEKEVQNTQGEQNVEKDKISVVSTIFAPYDFIKEVAGDKAEITMLIPPGSESHSYEPTPQDMIKIQKCDVFVYAGGDSDEWVSGVLESMDTSNMKIVTLMDCVETVEEEIVEGMEDDHGHDHGGEIHAEDIEDRTLEEFAGEWQSVLPYFEDGTLDEYISAVAEENETTAGDEKEKFLQKRATDYKTIDITANDLTVHTDSGSESGTYTYAEYRPVYNDDKEITGVYYVFRLEKPSEQMPTYIAFSDHGFKPHTDEEDGEHEEHEEELAHFHMRYGSETIDTLIDVENWAPTFYPKDAKGEEIKEALISHDHEAELDEHVWTSPKNAKLIVQKISNTLCEVDSKNKEVYEQNTNAYLNKLDELDKEFQQVVDSAARKTLIFGDRFPFRYLTDAYGLDYFAAFPGCSTETEASAATVAYLIDKVKAEEIPVVFHVEMSNEKMANTISEATGAKVMLFHACHNITKAELEEGVSYLDLMKQNVENLKEALK